MTDVQPRLSTPFQQAPPDLDHLALGIDVITDGHHMRLGGLARRGEPATDVFLLESDFLRIRPTHIGPPFVGER
ncbi:hypothetical protein AB0G67_17940 [Streptomyces sp. NPDC021056]|uniref:hypothetical protein n=1 Tax=Streptomyces sp. NPDC021056 TaxID=3155012 RepID=UPI0033DDE74C